MYNSKILCKTLTKKQESVQYSPIPNWRSTMQVQANWENQLLALAGHVSDPSTRPFFSYWAGDASLRKAYRQAEKITAGHSKSFYVASALLPEEKRSGVRALY